MSISEAYRPPAASPQDSRLMAPGPLWEQLAVPDTLAPLDHAGIAPVSPAPSFGAAIAPERPQESFPLCEIVSETEVDPDTLGIPAELRPKRLVHVEMHDPQLDAYDPAVLAMVAAWEAGIVARVRERKAAGLYDRLPGRAGGTYYAEDGSFRNGRDKKHWGDQATREYLLESLDSEGARAWLGTLPTGRALEITENINLIDEITDYRGRRLGAMDPLGRVMIAGATHARAIRHRFSDEAHSMVRFAKVYGGTLEGRRIASRGSGSAPGPMKAAQVIRRSNPGAKDPTLYHYDIDPRAVKAAENLARNEMQFNGEIKQRVINLLNPYKMAMEGLKMRLKGQRPHIDEGEGIWEYIDKGQLEAVSGRKLPEDPEVLFLKQMYRDSKRFVTFSQMLPDHPNAEFLDAIGWDYIVTRSVPQVLEAISKAGIPLRQVEVRILGDGVCVRYEIDKGPSLTERVAAKGRKVFARMFKHSQVELAA